MEEIKLTHFIKNKKKVSTIANEGRGAKEGLVIVNIFLTQFGRLEN